MKKKLKEKVAIAMSGGVDSSVAAAILKECGYDIVGVTALLTSEDSRCCSEDDIRIARQVADQLEFPHYVFDVKDSFKKEIIDDFINEYTSGRTPSPCGICNSSIKFGLLREKATRIGAHRMATGHYARLKQDKNGLYNLLKGIDQSKDQSYFLFNLTQPQLACSVFPLGNMTKNEVLVYAHEHKLITGNKGESQEICFVTKGHHGSWIEARTPNIIKEGIIIDTQGKVLGKHKGIHHYTIGQRRGLGIATGRPLYVVSINSVKNIIVLGDKSEAFKDSMTVKQINWIASKSTLKTFKTFTQIRYNHKAVESIITLKEKNTVAEVKFKKPQFAVTPGQIAVFYDGEKVIGGGWIS